MDDPRVATTVFKPDDAIAARNQLGAPYNGAFLRMGTIRRMLVEAIALRQLRDDEASELAGVRLNSSSKRRRFRSDRLG
ncbi:MAG: hypothetical protein CMJ75_03630 [Planctomycetaceae bacterium]|nr:hypothetical protein [Planctomycetaceae bacterium]